MTINSSNRSALSAVNIKVLWRTGGVDDFIGKVSFLCRRRGQLSLYLTESKYFSMYMFACMGWCNVSKSQRYCVSKERNTTTNCIQFYLQQADIVHELKRRARVVHELKSQGKGAAYVDQEGCVE